MTLYRTILPIAATALLAACGAPADPNAEKEAANKAAFENISKAWNTGDEKLLADNLADNFVTHNPDPMIKSTGKQQWIDALKMYKASSPDMMGEGKVMVVDGDWVAGVAMVKGTNTGDMPGMPATNKAWEASGIDVIRFENGKAVEAWSGFDVMKMMADLGMNMEGGATWPWTCKWTTCATRAARATSTSSSMARRATCATPTAP
jgi:predicted ester cyclase